MQIGACQKAYPINVKLAENELIHKFIHLYC